MAVAPVFELTYTDVQQVGCCYQVCKHNQVSSSSSLLGMPLINRYIPWDLILSHSLTHSHTLGSLIDGCGLRDPWPAYGSALLSPYCIHFLETAPSLLHCTAEQNDIPFWTRTSSHHMLSTSLCALILFCWTQSLEPDSLKLSLDMYPHFYY